MRRRGLESLDAPTIARRLVANHETAFKHLFGNKMGFDRKLSTDEIAAAVERAFARQEGREPRLPTGSDNAVIGELASIDTLEYELQRDLAAAGLGIRVSALDKLIKGRRAAEEDENAALPHWNVEPSAEPVDGAALLNNLRQVFRRYIVLPKGADIALPLWVLHAWTMDAGDISPLMVLVSPTKRCGKTSALIVLYFLTPRSELSSNITASALFRYIEDVRPTLLIDEADSFAKDNEELRGILNSGHIKAAAHVIRNLKHKPRRFSTWAPKAVATIGALADTLEDRAVVVRLQRKPRGATVERLGRRDNAEFAALRSQAARWAADDYDKLVDSDPKMPDLNDRAADNWRPLLAIADLAGGTWPKEARRAACLLSGEEQDGAIGVELLRDIRSAFGDGDVIRSSDLVAQLTADPERPWAEWKHGRPLTQKQLAGLLAPFHIISLTVHPPGQPDGKGYRRIDFEEAWAAYCPGQNISPQQSLRFRSVQAS
jgi:putative DNA primase/helicase